MSGVPAVLVTGGTGFIGSHLVDRLVSLGIPVRCLVRKSSSLRYLPASGVELAQGDLLTGAGLEAALADIPAVIHVAGVTKARTAEAYYAGNAQATANLLGCCGQVRRFVHVSSLAAAGPSADGRPLDEDAPPHPVSQYGRAKLASEQAVRNSPLADRAVIVRPPVVFGPRDADVWQILRAATRGMMLQIGRGDRFFSMVYVMDLVDGLVAAMKSSVAGGRTYFLAHPQAVSWRNFGATAAQLEGRRLRTIAVPALAAAGVGLAAEWWSLATGRPGILSRDKIAEASHPFWTCNPARAERELGFEAKYTLREAMAETLAWYREAGWLT